MSVFNTDGKSELYKLVNYLWGIGESHEHFREAFADAGVEYNEDEIVRVYKAMESEFNNWCEASEAEMAQERSILC